MYDLANPDGFPDNKILAEVYKILLEILTADHSRADQIAGAMGTIACSNEFPDMNELYSVSVCAWEDLIDADNERLTINREQIIAKMIEVMQDVVERSQS